MTFCEKILGPMILVSVLALASCNPPDDSVLITGTVVNIDTGEPAPGVRVTLLETGFGSKVESDDFGSFSILVPKGSMLYLYTDDFDASKDEWIPLINVDVPALVADKPLENFLVHACPVTEGSGFGSEAVWNKVLRDDDSNGDIFDAATTRGSGGAIAMLVAACDGMTAVGVDSIEVDFNDPRFPTAYFNSEGLFASGNDTTVVPLMYGPNHLTDSLGWVQSFGDPSYPGGTVVATVTDRKSGRDWVFGPHEIPVRPGTISLVWSIVLDDVTGYSLQDYVPCFLANP